MDQAWWRQHMSVLGKSPEINVLTEGFKTLSQYESLLLESQGTFIASLLKEKICVIADNIGDGESNWDCLNNEALENVAIPRLDLETFNIETTTADYFIIFVHYVGSQELSRLIKTLVQAQKYHQLNIYNNETFYEFDKYFVDISSDIFLEFVNYDEEESYRLEVYDDSITCFAGNGNDYPLGSHQLLKRVFSSPSCSEMIVVFTGEKDTKLIFKNQELLNLETVEVRKGKGSKSELIFENCKVRNKLTWREETSNDI